MMIFGYVVLGVKYPIIAQGGTMSWVVFLSIRFIRPIATLGSCRNESTLSC